MKFKSEFEKNSQNPTKKLGFYLILTLKIKRFDPLRNLQRLVNGDIDEMTMNIKNNPKLQSHLPSKLAFATSPALFENTTF